MFEEGDKLKAKHGRENVFDFSLGNPNLDPPEKVNQRLIEILNHPIPALHGYMSNAGYPETRRAVADFLSREHDLPFSEQDVIMTCGAAGALNAVLKALIEPGDELSFWPLISSSIFFIPIMSREFPWWFPPGRISHSMSRPLSRP